MVKYISYKQLFIYYESRKNEGVHMEINIGIIAIVVLVIAILAILASGYVKASPNKAYIISGIKREPKVLIGRAGIKIPFLEKKDELILKQISIDIKTNGYIPTKDCNGVQREHNKKLNNGLPILHKVPPKRDYGRYFCIMAEKGGTSHGGLTEKLSPFFHAKKQEVNAYGR